MKILLSALLVGGWWGIAVAQNSNSLPFISSWTSGLPKNLRPSQLDVRITARTNIILPLITNRAEVVVGVPIRVENRSREAISARISHEWYGGQWPPTDLGAAARPIGATNWTKNSVYLVGNLSVAHPPVTWQPGESHDFLVRMNWRGTVMVPDLPLIDAGKPGRYQARFSLMFTTPRGPEFILSPPIEIELKPAPER